MTSILTWIIYTSEVTLHYWFLAGTIHLGSWILGSDSLVTLTPSIFDASSIKINNNVTQITFGLKYFAINETLEDIEFSDIQEDGLFSREKVIGRIFTIVPFHIMGSILIVPMIMLIYRAWYKKQGWSNPATWIPLVRFYHRSIPVLAITTLFYLVSIFIMLQSSLCGPNYIELGYNLFEDYYDDDYYYGFDDNKLTNSTKYSYFRTNNGNHYYDDDDCFRYDDCYYELEAYGTDFKIHENIGATCQVGPSAIGFAVMTVVWAAVFLLIVERMLLRRRLHKMEQASAEQVQHHKMGYSHIVDMEGNMKALDPVKPSNNDADGDDDTDAGSEVGFSIY